VDWKRVEEGLEHGFSGRGRRYGSTLLVERRRPFSLAEVVAEAMSEEERDEYGCEEGEEAACLEGDSLGQLLTQNGVEHQSLLSFDYYGGVGMASGAGLVLVGNGSRRYLAFWGEGELCQAVAAIDPWHDEPAASALVARLLSRGGESFGWRILGHLPDEVTNYMPDLVPREVVRRAFFDYLEWWNREDSAWLDLAEQHYALYGQPEQLQRRLGISGLLPRRVVRDAEGAREERERRAIASRAIPDRVREQLFEEWFADAYTEETQGDLGTAPPHG
jgi:hypothetical protein